MNRHALTGQLPPEGTSNTTLVHHQVDALFVHAAAGGRSMNNASCKHRSPVGDVNDGIYMMAGNSSPKVACPARSPDAVAVSYQHNTYTTSTSAGKIEVCHRGKSHGIT